MATDAPLDRALHALADPTRRRILQALKECAMKKGQGSSAEKPIHLCAGDIQERIHLSQPTISHHMTILTKSGLVAAVKHGQWRWYRRNEKSIRHLIKTLRAKL